MAMQLAGLPADNPTFQRYQAKIHQVLDLVDKRLGEVPWLAGNELTVADVMIIFSLTTMREVLCTHRLTLRAGMDRLTWIPSLSHSTCQNTRTSCHTSRKSPRDPRTRAISRRPMQILRLRSSCKGRRHRCTRLLLDTSRHRACSYLPNRSHHDGQVRFWSYPIFTFTSSPLPHRPNSSACSAYHLSSVAEFTYPICGDKTT